MVSEAPPFWWKKPDWRAWMLYPASWLYGSIARSRMEKAPRIPVEKPVICVGNFTVGGAGKTPTALALADAAAEIGLKPGFLSRGYRGNLRVTNVVDPSRHNAHDVGDEPMLLADKALTVVSPNRLEGARRLVEEGADIIIMDDGFQSASIGFDYALLVVDTDRGIGNGHIIPGGPMRAPMLDQMRNASAVLVIGNGLAADPVIRSAGRAAKPVFQGKLAVCDPDSFRDRVFLAFAAIGNPGKFFESLRSTGARVFSKHSFGDHHIFTDDEIRQLLDEAEKENLEIVTTSKDMARLASGHGGARQLLEKTSVLDVELQLEQPGALKTIIGQAISAFKKRELTGPAAATQR
jgi:tetraacyldisaccharide 4'-kinase